MLLKLFEMLKEANSRFNIINNVKYVESQDVILINCNFGKSATLQFIDENTLYIRSDKNTQKEIKSILEKLLEERKQHYANII